MTSKQVLSIFSIFLEIIGYGSYLRQIFSGKIKPHAFTWLIWTLIAGITFAAQLYDRGGAGSWPTAVNCIGSILIFVLSLKRGEKNITPIDWAFFLSGLAAIPLWLATRQPLYSVILVTLIDSLGYGPTFRKAYHRPFEESVVIYIAGTASFVLSILAMEHYSFITCLYPVASMILNIALISMIAFCRQGVREIE